MKYDPKEKPTDDDGQQNPINSSGGNDDLIIPNFPIDDLTQLNEGIDIDFPLPPDND